MVTSDNVFSNAFCFPAALFACKHIPNVCYEYAIQCLLAPRNTPLRISSAEGICLRVALAHALLMPALLPVGDESAMNSEGMGTFFSTNLLFSATFFRVGSELRRERGSPVSGSLRSRIGRVLIGLAYGVAIIHPARH
jgi:hypothetical protein